MLPYLSVARQRRAAAEARRAPRPRGRGARRTRCWPRVGLADRAASMPRELSGGELQRIAIARALVHRPQVVLADEPTGNLDPDSAHAVITLLRDCLHAEGATGILVTHSHAAAARADRVLTLTQRRARGDHAAVSTATAPAVAAAVLHAVVGGALAHQRGRLVLSMLAIALGVALGFAVAVINEAAIGEFTGGMKTLAGVADFEVRGPRSGFPDALFADLARDPDVAVASPVVEVDARIAGRDDALRVYGVDAFRAAAVTPAFVGGATDALDLLRPGVVFVSPAAAAWLAMDRADTLVVQAGLRDTPLAIAGFVQGDPGQRYAVMDIAAAQDLFGARRVVVARRPSPAPGADAAAVRARIAQALPPGVAIGTPQDSVTMASRMSRAYRVNLNVLALVALFTGGLLVFSTQALSIVRRRAQFALLRTLGLRARTARRVAGCRRRAGRRRGLRRRPGRRLRARRRRAAVSSARISVPATSAARRRRWRSIRRRLSCLPRSGTARRDGGQLPAGARSGARSPGSGAQGGRRAARVRAAFESAAGTGAPRGGRGRHARAADRGPAALRVRRDRAAADRHVAAAAAHRRRGARAAARPPRVSRRARARSIARRAGPGAREPRDDRRQRFADGVDGDHGRVVPAIARRLAGRHPAGGRVRARGLRGRQRRTSPTATSARSPASTASRGSGSCARRACCSRRTSRAWRCSRATCRATIPARRLPLVGDPGATARRRSAAGLGERGRGRPVRTRARRRGRAAARRTGAPRSSSPACGATTRGSRDRWSSTARRTSR